jgi:flavin-dependent dehydrogenase
MRRTHPLIVGGGPAGATAAIMLGKAGARPLLIERSVDHHDIVCGGFLGGDALASLAAIGMNVLALGARPVTQLNLVAGPRSTLIDLPFAAAGLSRRTLDQALLTRAAESGATIERGIAAKLIEPDELRLTLADGSLLEAAAIFLATGKYELRGGARAVDNLRDPPLGLRVRLGGSPAMARALGGKIELILIERGYAGLILQEDGSANLCLTVAKSRLVEAEGNRHRLLADLAAESPLLGERLGQASGMSGWASVARVPYGWRARSTTSGLFRLGDQAAVIASLAGDGVAIALSSGRMAAEHYLKDSPDSAISYQQAFSRTSRQPLWIAERLRSIAEKSGIAAAAIAALSLFPGAARAASRVTRIGTY